MARARCLLYSAINYRHESTQRLRACALSEVNACAANSALWVGVCICRFGVRSSVNSSTKSNSTNLITVVRIDFHDFREAFCRTPPPHIQVSGYVCHAFKRQTRTETAVAVVGADGIVLLLSLLLVGLLGCFSGYHIASHRFIYMCGVVLQNWASGSFNILDALCKVEH